MKRVLMAVSLLGVLGCSTGSGVLRPAEPSFSCEVPGYVSEPHYRADVPMGRLEVQKLSTSAPPPAPPPASEPESAQEQERVSRHSPRFPAVRLRVVAEAVPLGTLAAALSRELGLGIVVAPRLVDLRVSLSLPDSSAEALFNLLHLHYDVAAEAGMDSVIVLEDRLEVLHRHYEPPEVLVQLIPVTGLPAADVASAYCKLMATERGSANVVGDVLIVKGERPNLERLNALIRALREHQKPTASAEQKATQ
jgi:type II secretory pathway component GspD/PulD (secretin)